MARTFGWRGYLATILLSLVFGAMLGSPTLSKHLGLGQVRPKASHAAQFVGYGSALLMACLLSRRVSHQALEDGEGMTFLHAILTPMIALIVILFGYRLLLLLNIPGKTERGIFNSLYVIGMVGHAGWLSVAWVGNAEALIKLFEGSAGETMSPLDRPQSLGQGTWSSTAAFKNGPDGTLVVENASVNPALGRYKVIKELGRGSMGVVYLGKDPTINRSVAIKTMRLDQLDDPDHLKEVKERFFREAESTGRLSHPNIVTIYDAGEEEDIGYIAMELLDGMALKVWCRKENLLPVKRVMEIMAKVADALDYAHSQGVVHRDIKPANIMVVKNGTIKVMDFGIARLTTSTKTQTRVILGTPSYMSPEQLTGATVDGRSDIFSLGVVLFELLTGEKPFEAETISALLFKIAHAPHRLLTSIRPDLPASAEAIVNRALQKDPAKRYQTAAELTQDLHTCLQTLSA